MKINKKVVDPGGFDPPISGFLSVNMGNFILCTPIFLIRPAL